MRRRKLVGAQTNASSNSTRSRCRAAGPCPYAAVALRWRASGRSPLALGDRRLPVDSAGKLSSRRGKRRRVDAADVREGRSGGCASARRATFEFSRSAKFSGRNLSVRKPPARRGRTDRRDLTAGKRAASSVRHTTATYTATMGLRAQRLLLASRRRIELRSSRCPPPWDAGSL